MAEAVLSSFISSLINKLALMKEIQLSTRQMCKAAIITVCSIPLTLTYFYEIRIGKVNVQYYLFIFSTINLAVCCSLDLVLNSQSVLYKPH